jgi:hypothetical protein
MKRRSLLSLICATASFLAVAIALGNLGPAKNIVVWLFNYFTNKVDNFVVEMDNSLAELISFFLKQRG